MRRVSRLGWLGGGWKQPEPNHLCILDVDSVSVGPGSCGSVGCALCQRRMGAGWLGMGFWWESNEKQYTGVLGGLLMV